MSDFMKNVLKNTRLNQVMFVMLSFFIVFFYSRSFFRLDGLTTPIFFTIMVFLFAGLMAQTKMFREKNPNPVSVMASITAVFSGAALTFILNTVFFGPVIAASLIGLSYALFAKRYKGLEIFSRQVYCGAFVGMSSNIFGMPEIIFAGILAGIIQMAPRKGYYQIGGIFGTIAFIATYLTKELFGD